jgi:hypothetical protein
MTTMNYDRTQKYGRAVHNCNLMRDTIRWLRHDIERERRIENGALQRGHPIPWAEAKRRLEVLKSDIVVLERYVEELSTAEAEAA